MSSPPTPSLKRRKTKLDENILAKSKRFIKEDKLAPTITPAQTSIQVPTPATDDEPHSKRRKPRHATVEGQRFLKSKEKARLREYEGSSHPFAKKSRAPEDEKSPKKKKKSAKNKKKGKKATKKENHSGEDKHLETEERYRREALAYLQLWQGHREHWKFEKLKQVWLLKHALKEELVDSKCFDTLIDYISSMKGAARDKTVQEMGAIMSQFEGKVQGSPQEVNLGEGERKEYERARKIFTILASN